MEDPRGVPNGVTDTVPLLVLLESIDDTEDLRDSVRLDGPPRGSCAAPIDDMCLLGSRFLSPSDDFERPKATEGVFRGVEVDMGRCVADDGARVGVYIKL